MLTLYKIVFNRDHNWPSMCTLHACQWIHSVMRKNTYESSKDTWEWIPLEWMYKCNVMVCCPNVDYPIIICSQLQSMWRNYVCTLTCCGWSLSSYVDAFFGTDEEVNMLMQKYIYRKHIMLNKNLQNCWCYIQYAILCIHCTRCNTTHYLDNTMSWGCCSNLSFTVMLPR